MQNINTFRLAFFLPFCFVPSPSLLLVKQDSRCLFLLLGCASLLHEVGVEPGLLLLLSLDVDASNVAAAEKLSRMPLFVARCGEGGRGGYE